MMKTAIALILLIFGSSAFEPAITSATAHNYTFAAIAKAQTPGKCDVRAYIDDKDPDGTNIRVKANENSRVVKRIKSEDGAIVKVISYSNGWFEIASVKEASDGKTLFEGRGWIHSSLLGMRVAASDAQLYGEAKKAARVLMKLKAEETPLRLIACQGDWVKVQTGAKIGWLSPGGQCANPLTTCS